MVTLGNQFDHLEDHLVGSTKLKDKDGNEEHEQAKKSKKSGDDPVSIVIEAAATVAVVGLDIALKMNRVKEPRTLNVKVRINVLMVGLHWIRLLH